jgi:hypothetical protein
MSMCIENNRPRSAEDDRAFHYSDKTTVAQFYEWAHQVLGIPSESNYTKVTRPAAHWWQKKQVTSFTCHSTKPGDRIAPLIDRAKEVKVFWAVIISKASSSP